MSVGKNLGPDHPPGIETRRVLRYCYNSTQLYEQMQNHTQSMTNVCSVLVSDKTCERVGLKWSDGIHYPDGVQVRALKSSVSLKINSLFVVYGISSIYGFL